MLDSAELHAVQQTSYCMEKQNKFVSVPNLQMSASVTLTHVKQAHEGNQQAIVTHAIT